jgi:hypothetical protein
MRAGGSDQISTLERMRGSRSSRRVAGPLATFVTAASLALGGCGPFDDGGGSSEIPEQEGTQLMAALNAVKAATEADDCGAAESASEQFMSEAESVGDGLEESLKEPLTEGAERLQELVDSDCAETGPTGEADAEAPTDETETTSTTETTTDTTARPEREEPVEEEPEEAPPEEEPVEPEQPEPPTDDDDDVPVGPPDQGNQGVGPDGGVGAPTGGTGAREGEG